MFILHTQKKSDLLKAEVNALHLAGKLRGFSRLPHPTGALRTACGSPRTSRVFPQTDSCSPRAWACQARRQTGAPGGWGSLEGCAFSCRRRDPGGCAREWGRRASRLGLCVSSKSPGLGAPQVFNTVLPSIYLTSRPPSSVHSETQLVSGGRAGAAFRPLPRWPPPPQWQAWSRGPCSSRGR